MLRAEANASICSGEVFEIKFVQMKVRFQLQMMFSHLFWFLDAEYHERRTVRIVFKQVRAGV
jgi:hypothetical protein